MPLSTLLYLIQEFPFTWKTRVLFFILFWEPSLYRREEPGAELQLAASIGLMRFHLPGLFRVCQVFNSVWRAFSGNARSQSSSTARVTTLFSVLSNFSERSASRSMVLSLKRNVRLVVSFFAMTPIYTVCSANASMPSGLFEQMHAVCTHDEPNYAILFSCFFFASSLIVRATQ